MKLRRAESGHIHILGLLAFILMVAGALMLLDWGREITDSRDRLATLENRIQDLETKLKYLELKLDATSMLTNGRPAQESPR